MKYRALKSFSGKIAMDKGEVRELKSSLASEYVACGCLETTKAVRKKENK